MVVDPAVFSDKRSSKVTCDADEVPLLEALNILLWPRGFDYYVGQNCILISTEKGIASYRNRAMSADRELERMEKEGSMPALLKVVREEQADAIFQGADIRMILPLISKRAEIDIVADEGVLPAEKSVKLSGSLLKVSVLEALQVLLWPLGLDYDIREDSILITSGRR